MPENIESEVPPIMGEDLILDIDHWMKVRVWLQEVLTTDMLFGERMSKLWSFPLKPSALTEQVVKLEPDNNIIYLTDQLIRNKQTFWSIKPYPFGRYHDGYIYIEDSILSVPKSDPLNFIEPCHEFKAFINTPVENQLDKFITEVIEFAAACMNSRTNGTIHFGILDKPHGQIVGVAVDNKEEYLRKLKLAIDKRFEYKYRFAAHNSIKTPRFVAVLNRNNISAHTFVIEVDIEPQFDICGENIFHTFNEKKNQYKCRKKMFYIRKGAKTRDLLAQTTSANDYKKFVKEISELSQVRKKAEEKQSDLTEQVVKLEPYKMIIFPRVKLIRDKQTFWSIKPHPFGRYRDTFRYVEDSILSVTESGTSNFIEPCHEFKAFINTPVENELEKFITEVIEFAAACMNSRTNGTIHFGILDKPHGQIVGVAVDDKEKYLNALKSAIDDRFEYKDRSAAHKSIKTPRFVEVLNRNDISAHTFVIEVDIEPQFDICGENIFHTFNVTKDNTRKDILHIRHGAIIRNLRVPTTSAEPSNKHEKSAEVEYNQFVKKISKLSQLRKKAEEKHFKRIKSSTQGSRLINMITGGASSLDKSNFENYVIVTNKSHTSHLENLGFLIELKPTAVLDFDPESAEQGLLIWMNPHLLAKYERMDNNNSVHLELFKDTNWFLVETFRENTIIIIMVN